MAREIIIRNSRFFKSPLSIDDIIGKENWVYGTSDENGRIETGKADGSGPLIVYDPIHIGRGVQVLNIESRKEIQLALPHPATEGDVRMLYCMAQRIASLWKADNIALEEEDIKVSEIQTSIEKDIEMNVKLLETFEEAVGKEGATLFCATLPISFTIEEFRAFAADYESFGKVLHQKQKTEAYFSVALFRTYNDELCSHYVFFDGGDIILPKVPEMQYVSGEETLSCSRAFVMIPELFPDEKSTRVDFATFMERIPAEKKTEFDCRHVLIRPLSKKELQKLV